VTTATCAVIVDATDGPWNRSDPVPEVADSGENWAQIENLTPGEEYYFRVVAVNGISPNTRETRSDPPWKELIVPHGQYISHATSEFVLTFVQVICCYFCKKISGYYHYII